MNNSILIIDDDKRLRDLLENFLIEKKFKVYISDDFVSAKEIISKFQKIITIPIISCMKLKDLKRLLRSKSR